LQATTLDWLTDQILAALARGERVRPAALLFLLRRFSAADSAAIAEPLGAALAREIDLQAQPETLESADWLAVFSEAATISDDPRLPRVAADLLTSVRLSWGPPDPTDRVMRAIEACLTSVNVPEARELAAEAIDALERVVAGAYRPSEGMSHQIAGSAFVRGGLSDQVRSASTLLTAYMLTARLPYAMLADELMHRVVTQRDQRDAPFALTCEAAQVCCRLAALHHDDEYRRTAVLAVDTDYLLEATRTLDALEPSVRERGVEAAPFGLALAEWLNLQ
jgi:hypothetical protein